MFCEKVKKCFTKCRYGAILFTYKRKGVVIMKTAITIEVSELRRLLRLYWEREKKAEQLEETETNELIKKSQNEQKYKMKGFKEAYCEMMQKHTGTLNNIDDETGELYYTDEEVMKGVKNG